ncbi:FG-GAP-like repeat-containing protein [Streptomyces sp. t39]|uniref:FG-GAP-like repeat-containing protein n=1 Tax=Streptomyces sp. t39 TaxID=1828156 RepID=UPI0011CDE42F|nr:FG-GAP-like repeat-containing protein [Streptomyces sp. t39]TXS48199.1 VCBS repeat-containing protein [Streptomyces sp. t39]
MIHARPVRRRAAAAVVTVLAVTAGASAVAAPATAVPANGSTTGVAAASTAAVAAFPARSTIFGVTATGFLTSTEVPSMDEAGTTHIRQWVRADGGPATDLNYMAKIASTGSGDIVAFAASSRAWLKDLATDKDLRSVTVGGDTAYAGAAGKALFTTTLNVEGNRLLHMHTTTSGAARMTTGLPGDATNVVVTAGTAEHALLTYSTGAGETAKRHVALLDLAANAVTEAYALPATAAKGDIAVSATHLAWVEYDADDRVTVVAVDRATKAPQRFAVGTAWRNDVEVGLAGGWVTYGTRSGLTDIEPDALHALTARSLADGTTTRRLLDHTLTSAVAPDGAQVVRGGTVGGGEGLYRIAPGPEGAAPVAELVASSGESTGLGLLASKVPAVVDLDADGGRVPLEWTLSRYNATATVTLRHVRTGRTSVAGFMQPENAVVRYDWLGDLNSGGAPAESAYNGDYTWEISAKPLNGIGPELKRSGTFTVTRKAAGHDYNDNGSPDLLLRDSAGTLVRADSYYNPWINENGQLSAAEQKTVGSGWNMHNRIEAAGNLAGDAHGDLVARDTTGVLWLYQGKGDGTFATRVRVGGGWQTYRHLAGGSDLTGDGRPDLVATDTTGALWLYRATGSVSDPFAARKKIGLSGWQQFNSIEATGNIAGTVAGDLVARDTAGVLWLYQGRGDGTFAARVRIGSGWNTYQHLVGIGDADRDGRPDLFAYGPDGTYLYKGTGSATRPFGTKEATSLPDAILKHTAVV